jgi:DsbC/DsbD-like thiol-disulfide interchange protein
MKMFNKLGTIFLIVLIYLTNNSFAQQISLKDSLKGPSVIFRSEVEKIVGSLMTPDDEYPVSVNSVLVKDTNSDFMAVVIKARIAEGWHIYSSVPATHHYIVTELTLELPMGVEKIGEWLNPLSKESTKEKGVYIYENQVVFIHYLKTKEGVNMEGSIKAGIDYQCCDSSMCNPPQTKLFKLSIRQ